MWHNGKLNGKQKNEKYSSIEYLTFTHTRLSVQNRKVLSVIFQKFSFHKHISATAKQVCLFVRNSNSQKYAGIKVKTPLT